MAARVCEVLHDYSMSVAYLWVVGGWVGGGRRGGARRVVRDLSSCGRASSLHRVFGRACRRCAVGWVLWGSQSSACLVHLCGSVRTFPARMDLRCSCIAFQSCMPSRSRCLSASRVHRRTQSTHGSNEGSSFGGCCGGNEVSLSASCSSVSLSL